MQDEVTLWRGDCLELMKDIPDGSVDMILCDLPYGTTACKWDSVIPFEPLWTEYKRVIKRNGAVVLTASQPFTTALISSNMRWFKYSLVWLKDNPSGFANAKVKPLSCHEDVLVFSEGRTVYNPQVWHSKPMNTVYRSGGDKSGSIAVGTKQIDVPPEKRNRTERLPLSYLKINTVNGQSREKVGHPTQKPVALMEYLIRTYTNEGETVLDNCMGSGTTGVACLRTGRRFIGIEKDAKYFEIASERIAAESASFAKI